MITNNSKRCFIVLFIICFLITACDNGKIKYQKLFDDSYIPKYNFTQKVPWGSDATICFASNWKKQNSNNDSSTNTYVDYSTLSIIMIDAYTDANSNMTEEDVYNLCKEKLREYGDYSDKYSGFINDNEVKGLMSFNVLKEKGEKVASTGKIKDLYMCAAIIRMTENKYMIVRYVTSINEYEDYFKEFLNNILPYYKLIG